MAAAAQAVEAVGVLVAAVVSAVDTASGHSYQQSSGIALTVLAFAAAAAVAFVVPGLLRARQWSRTPALFTHLFVGTTGIYLIEGHHPGWGLPAVLVAIAGFAGVCAPPSWRALSRLGLREREELAAEAQAATAEAQAAADEPAQPRAAETPSPAKPRSAKPQGAKPQGAKAQDDNAKAQPAAAPARPANRKPGRPANRKKASSRRR